MVRNMESQQIVKGMRKIPHVLSRLEIHDCLITSMIRKNIRINI
ncbi:hypothetical protein HMPREF3038_00684 [Akkermansia sp. KLE1797]|nr:hypothetical protein HMPREF3038_00684 [Akkermansia sp. KLE1797]KXU54232.1 hypothetical protein HMPREF3039_01560 [Akkermansia sp. KLE1798]KZA04586.1 hypothetical protein HMPREF1326_01640 [Akkermansia sp. KLE1605]